MSFSKCCSRNIRTVRAWTTLIWTFRIKKYRNLFKDMICHINTGRINFEKVFFSLFVVDPLLTRKDSVSSCTRSIYFVNLLSWVLTNSIVMVFAVHDVSLATLFLDFETRNLKAYPRWVPVPTSRLLKKIYFDRKMLLPVLQVCLY